MTTAPTNVGTSQAEIVQLRCSRTALAAFLGIERPAVAAGDAVFPVLATSAGRGGPHSDSTGRTGNRQPRSIRQPPGA